MLVKDLNFALRPLKLNYGDYLTPFELLFRDVTRLPVTNNILERLKLRSKRHFHCMITIVPGINLTSVKRKMLV